MDDKSNEPKDKIRTTQTKCRPVNRIFKNRFQKKIMEDENKYINTANIQKPKHDL